MRIINKITSNDNKNIKFLQQTEDNIITETAFVEENSRNIICFASQLGCLIGCKFCYNGVHKNYCRDLTSNEIVNQCVNVVEELKLKEIEKPILFSCMGIGEPLLNYDNVVKAILKLDELYPNSKFAIATTGIIPEYIAKLAIDLERIQDFKLTISLHASNDRVREMIIPILKPLKDIKKYLNEYRKSHHRFEWNYIIFDGINDSEENALELVDFIDDNDRVKITSFNEIEGCDLKSSHNQDEFLNVLSNNNVDYKIFESSGTDIDIGCGQMVTHYNQMRKLIK